MKITIPHIHKIEGEAGFWAKVTRLGEIKDLKIKTLEGLRQIEGILIGRRVQEVPMIVSRICGICPVVHILNACCALEKALEVKISPLTVLIRKLFLASQIIQSHTLHLFFMALPDFFNIESNLDLLKRFKKETKAALSIRDFALKITKVIGGRAVHPITPRIGGFSKLPEKDDLKAILREYPEIFQATFTLINLFKNLKYPAFKRNQIFASLISDKDYSFYESDRIFICNKRVSVGDFYSNQIEEDLKGMPVKKVKYRGRPYMLGAIARMKNNNRFLNPRAKEIFKQFQKQKNDAFENTFYNLFYQAIETLHFIEETEKLIKEILKEKLIKEEKEVKISKGSGLSAMEAPRGTLFTYFELDREGRVLDCNIITPTAQFLNNLEEDLKTYLPNILSLPEKEKIRKIRSLIRIYDPCISCAIH